jgi:hypothetical protein
MHNKKFKKTREPSQPRRTMYLLAAARRLPAHTQPNSNSKQVVVVVAKLFAAAAASGGRGWSSRLFQ